MSDIFTQVVEALLAGDTLCAYTQTPQFEYLQDETHYQRVHDYLFKIGRSLRQTSTEDGYVLTHADLGSNRAKRDAKAAFEDMRRHIRPLIFWLSLAKKLEPTGKPLKAGDYIDQGELLRAIGESSDVTRELAELSRLKPFQTESRKPSGQLARVLQKLTDMGYFTVVGHSQSIYRATAKFSVFYDAIAFIREYEQLDTLNAENNPQLEIIDDGRNS